MRLTGWLAVAAVVLSGGLAQAQTYNAPVEAGTKLVLEPTVSLQTVSYRGVDSFPVYSWEVKRKLVGVGVYIPMAPVLSLDFNGGLVFDSEVNDLDQEGDGHYLGAGLDWLAVHNSALGLTAYLKLDQISEEWKPYSYTQTVTEGHVGALLTFSPNAAFFPYVGLDLVPYNESEIEAEKPAPYPYYTRAHSVDVEREDNLMLRLGALIKLSSLALRPEVILLGERTFQFSLLFPL